MYRFVSFYRIVASSDTPSARGLSSLVIRDQSINQGSAFPSSLLSVSSQTPCIVAQILRCPATRRRGAGAGGPHPRAADSVRCRACRLVAPSIVDVGVENGGATLSAGRPGQEPIHIGCIETWATATEVDDLAPLSVEHVGRAKAGGGKTSGDSRGAAAGGGAASSKALRCRLRRLRRRCGGRRRLRRRWARWRRNSRRCGPRRCQLIRLRSRRRPDDHAHIADKRVQVPANEDGGRPRGPLCHSGRPVGRLHPGRAGAVRPPGQGPTTGLS